MKKILSILTICLMSFTLVGNKVSVAKTEDVPTIEEKAVELNNEEVEVNETDEYYTESWLNILNSYSVETIQKWYLMEVIIRKNPLETKSLDPLVYCSDEMKEHLVNTFLNTYFTDNIEIQNKIKQFPLDYQYVLFEKLRQELKINGVI